MKEARSKNIVTIILSSFGPLFLGIAMISIAIQTRTGSTLFNDGMVLHIGFITLALYLVTRINKSVN